MIDDVSEYSNSLNKAFYYENTWIMLEIHKYNSIIYWNTFRFGNYKLNLLDIMQKSHLLYIRILSRYSNTSVTEWISELFEYLFQLYWWTISIFSSNEKSIIRCPLWMGTGRGSTLAKTHNIVSNYYKVHYIMYHTTTTTMYVHMVSLCMLIWSLNYAFVTLSPHQHFIKIIISSL